MEKDKVDSLRALIRGYGSAVVAFSAGVDSTLLAKIVSEELGEKGYALTITSPFNPELETTEAVTLAGEFGITHLVVAIEKFSPTILANPQDRCYHCKKAIFSKIQEEAQKLGVENILDGSNIDDLSDYRPGKIALEELGIKSPLLEAGWTKADIREYSKELGLPTWEKPAFACLASRIPYDEEITLSKLKMIERAEEYLSASGFKQYRVRCHGDLARVELLPEDRKKFYSDEMMDKLSLKLKEFGFKYVALDCSGYKMGNLNRF